MNSTPTTDVLVTSMHLRTIPFYSVSPGFCAGGTLLWFKRHGLDARRFFRVGLPASQFDATGCAMGKALADWARTGGKA